MKQTFVLLPLILAACADPRASCFAVATQELQVVRALIADTKATLHRGYAIHTQTQTIIYSDFCDQADAARNGFSFCDYPHPIVQRTPAAVDVETEKRKLAALQNKERELVAFSALTQQKCEMDFSGAS